MFHSPAASSKIHYDRMDGTGEATRIDIGCDVARYGDDRTVIGYKVDEKAMFYKRKSGQDLMQTADDIMELGLRLMEKYRFDKAIPIKIDDSASAAASRTASSALSASSRSGSGGWILSRSTSASASAMILLRHHHLHDERREEPACTADAGCVQKPVQLILPNDNDLSASFPHESIP